MTLGAHWIAPVAKAECPHLKSTHLAVAPGVIRFDCGELLSIPRTMVGISATQLMVRVNILVLGDEESSSKQQIWTTSPHPYHSGYWYLLIVIIKDEILCKNASEFGFDGDRL